MFPIQSVAAAPVLTAIKPTRQAGTEEMPAAAAENSNLTNDKDGILIK